MCVLVLLRAVKERGSLRVNYIVSPAQHHTFFTGSASRIAHCGPTVITVLPRGLLGQIRGAVWKMSFEHGCCLNKDVCLGLSTESEVDAQYEVWVWWNALHSFTVSPIFNTFILSPTFSVWPWSGILSSSCCVMSWLGFFSLRSHQSKHAHIFYSLQGSIKDAHFIWYHHLWFPSTMVTLPAIWFSFPWLFSIFPASYHWKWQCYLQSLSSGFADRENSGGDHIRLGHRLQRMIGCACIRLHLQNLICSQCRASTDKWLKMSGGGKIQCMGHAVGLEKKKINWEDGRKIKTENDPWWW